MQALIFIASYMMVDTWYVVHALKGTLLLSLPYIFIFISRYIENFLLRIRHIHHIIHYNSLEKLLEFSFIHIHHTKLLYTLAHTHSRYLHIQVDIICVRILNLYIEWKHAIRNIDWFHCDAYRENSKYIVQKYGI